MRVVRWLALAAVSAACGRESAEPKVEPKAPGPVPAATDTIRSGGHRPDDTTAMKAHPPLRDSAFGPRMAVDSLGRAVPLKKHP